MKTLKALVLASIFVFSISGTTSAREVKFDKRVDPSVLQTQLITAGFKVSYIECSGIHCKVTMPDAEKKDPMPEIRKYAYVDAQEIRMKKMSGLKALYGKWEAGTITNEEKDELIKAAVGMILGR